MKKTLSAVLLTAFSVLCLCAGEQLWDGSLDTVKLTSGNKLKDVSVKTEDGVLDVSATSEGPSVTYVSVEIRVKPFKLAGKSLAFDVWSDQPKTTDAFYVRLQDAKRRNILSFQQWNTPLKAQPENRFVQPGFSNRLMRWEATEIKADENTDADRIVFFIGSRGDGKKMSLKIRNIELADAAALPEKPAGKAVPSNGVGCVSAAALDNGVLDMVKAFEKANGVRIPYQLVDRRPGDLATCYSTPAKSEKVLGWKAEFGLEDMCRDSWNWQKNNPNGFNK